MTAARGALTMPRLANLQPCARRRTSDEAGANDTSLTDTLSVERVAGLVAGVPLIGMARAALEQAGWSATIAGNRITVNDEICAQYTPSRSNPTGVVEPYWVVYTFGGTAPVWIVGGEPQK